MNQDLKLTIPGPDPLSAFKGLVKDGFLDYTGLLWKEHGDLACVNLGLRKFYLAVHPDAVEQINVTSSDKYDKGKSYDVVRKYLTGNGLISSTGELWKKQRKLMAPFFTPKGIQTYSEIMIHDAVELAHRWEKMDGEWVNMEEEMMRVAASIILKSMFSSELEEEALEMKACIEYMINFVTTQQQGLYFPTTVPTKRNRKYLNSRRKVHNYIERLIQGRKALPVEEWPSDLLSKLMLAKDEVTGAPMSDSLLKDESITMFFAGHETTARTMSNAWYALSRNPEVLVNLQLELDSVLQGRIPTVEDLRKLPYTLKIIKEVLRLYPPAPFYARDAIEDDVINGYKIRKGSAILMSPYYTHRHPEFWEDPLKFDPDRWEPEKEKSRHRHAYHPFSSGKRVCIGNNFSLLESHILLATLAQKFTPVLRHNFEITWEMKGTLSAKEGFPMKIVKRDTRHERYENKLEPLLHMD
jgi:cytochrome P450